MSGKNKAMAVAAVASLVFLSGCIADDNDNYEKAERYNFHISPMGFAPVEYATEYHPYADDHQTCSGAAIRRRLLPMKHRPSRVEGRACATRRQRPRRSAKTREKRVRTLDADDEAVGAVAGLDGVQFAQQRLFVADEADAPVSAAAVEKRKNAGELPSSGTADQVDCDDYLLHACDDSKTAVACKVRILLLDLCGVRL